VAEGDKGYWRLDMAALAAYVGVLFSAGRGHLLNNRILSWRSMGDKYGGEIRRWQLFDFLTLNSNFVAVCEDMWAY
jgi:hypothetical protein